MKKKLLDEIEYWISWRNDRISAGRLRWNGKRYNPNYDVYEPNFDMYGSEEERKMDEAIRKEWYPELVKEEKA